MQGQEGVQIEYTMRVTVPPSVLGQVGLEGIKSLMGATSGNHQQPPQPPQQHLIQQHQPLMLPPAAHSLPTSFEQQAKTKPQTEEVPSNPAQNIKDLKEPVFIGMKLGLAALLLILGYVERDSISALIQARNNTKVEAVSAEPQTTQSNKAQLIELLTPNTESK